MTPRSHKRSACRPTASTGRDATERQAYHERLITGLPFDGVADTYVKAARYRIGSRPGESCGGSYRLATRNPVPDAGNASVSAGSGGKAAEHPVRDLNPCYWHEKPGQAEWQAHCSSAFSLTSRPPRRRVAADPVAPWSLSLATEIGTPLVRGSRGGSVRELLGVGAIRR